MAHILRPRLCSLGTKTVTTIQTIQPLPTYPRNATIVVAVLSLLSALAFAVMALRILLDVAVLFLGPGNPTSRSPRILFFRTQLGQYVGCLLLGNAFISAAGLINFNWLTHSGLTRGSLCSAQATLMQIGLWSTCWFTAAHDMHTLMSLVFRVRQARWRSVAAMSVGWTIALVAGLVPLRKNHIYGPTGVSCSIMHSHPKEVFSFGALPIVYSTSMSIAVYPITFIVLYWKQAIQCRGRREDRPEEYHGFIRMIIWTMLWFPFASILLLSPLCIVYIFVYAGHSILPIPSVIADACAAVLGLVNIGLLCNTFRVISPISRQSNVETVLTFGHDASHESPATSRHDFYPHFAVPFHESGHRRYSSSQTSHSHSSSVDSKTGLLGAEKASQGLPETNLAPLMTHIIPPAELSRQLDRKLDDTESREKNASIGSPLHAIRLSPCPPRAVCVTEAFEHEPRTRNEKHPCSLRLSTETEAFGKGTEEQLSGFETAHGLDLSTLSDVPLTPRTSTLKKSATLAKRLCIPVESSPNTVDGSNPRHLSTTSRVSGVTLGTDCGSEYSGEIMHAYRVRPPNEKDALGPLPLGLQRFSAWTRRMTGASVWSQESALMTDEERDEAYWQFVDEWLDPRADADDGTDAARTTNKRATHARPVTLRIRPTKPTRSLKDKPCTADVV